MIDSENEPHQTMPQIRDGIACAILTSMPAENGAHIFGAASIISSIAFS
jgi:hypothetical protein